MMDELWTKHDHLSIYPDRDNRQVVLKIVSLFREQMAELTSDEARELATMLRKAAKTIEAVKAKR